MTRDEYELAAQHAHLALEIVSALASDLLDRGRLKPVTKTRIVEALRDYQGERFGAHNAVERLRRALQQEATLEREEKRERPR